MVTSAVPGWFAVNDGFEEGGYKQSGMGRLRGARGLAEFQEIKPTSTSYHRHDVDVGIAVADDLGSDTAATPLPDQ